MNAIDNLAYKAKEEVLDCIGCNDCMLACPLPEVQNVTIAELNYAINQQNISSSRVIDFVNACTQCQQCVPVCPADLSRADMVLYNKMKVEDFSPDQVVSLQIGNQVSPSAWSLYQLSEFLEEMPLFENVAKEELRRVVLRSTLRKLRPAEFLCREGEYHQRLYIILQGTVEQFISDDGGGQVRILVMGPGTFHGELAVMQNQVEQYSVKAVETTIALEIPKITIDHLIEFSSDFSATFTKLYNSRAILAHARKSPALAPFSDELLDDLLAEAQLENLSAGDLLCQQGDIVEDLTLVKTGFLKVTQTDEATEVERVLIYFREGDSFGGPKSITGEPTIPFTVIANTRAELIRIRSTSILRILEENPHYITHFQNVHENLPNNKGKKKTIPLKKDLGIENTTQLDISWSELIDQGVIQGHEMLVIDQNICTDCNNCVDACERRHGFSRLERSGLQLGSMLFPTACRHCEDPVCLMCSVNGIVRQPDGEITIVDNNCIGCGACAERCPYDNIQMHNLQEKTRRSWLQEMIAEITKPISVSRRSHELDKNKPSIAVKCDLCSGFVDYACVTACPVGAATRINPKSSFVRTDTIIGLEMKKTNEN